MTNANMNVSDSAAAEIVAAVKAANFIVRDMHKPAPGTIQLAGVGLLTMHDSKGDLWCRAVVALIDSDLYSLNHLYMGPDGPAVSRMAVGANVEVPGTLEQAVEFFNNRKLRFGTEKLEILSSK